MATKQELIAEIRILEELEKWQTKTNKTYYPLYLNKSRYLVLMGGGGSGKSIFAGQKIIHRTVTEKGHRFLIVRKVAKTLRESTFQQLRGQIPDYYDGNKFSINKTDMHITYTPNGNEIIFAGLDDVEKLKSIYNITGIWIEEASELEIEDYRQLDIRLRGKSNWYKQIIFTFNPVSITHWLKEEFFDNIKDDCTTSHTTYKDNKFLDEAAIKVLEDFKNTDPYYYAVYCKGEWGVLGRTVFDGEKVTNRIITLRSDKKGTRGRIELKDGKHIFVEDINGYLTIYEQPEPKKTYVIGADIAEGLEASTNNPDYSAAHVLDNNTYAQLAVWHGRLDVDRFAEELYKLGMFYNVALLAPEVNFNPGIISNLERLRYPKIYLRQQLDDYTHQIQKKYGFRTDKYNRVNILSDLIEFVRDHIGLINDIKTLEEMLTFIRDEKGKMIAQEGKHDDLVMSLAIALMAVLSGQQSKGKFEKKPDLSKLPKDYQDDYYNADAETKKYLAKKWGLI